MTLAPIRGAPHGASSPDFPSEEPKANQAQPAVAPVSGDPARASPVRQPQTPIEIRGSDIALRLRVIPEIPAITRASMTVHVLADPAGPVGSHTLDFLRMSDANARAFLTDLRNGRSPIVGAGDEGGTVEIVCEVTQGRPVFLIRKPGEQLALHNLVVDRSFDLKNAAEELLADLGA